MARKKNDHVCVTEPYLPPLAQFLPYLERIWEGKWLTNNDPFHQEFEAALSSHLGLVPLSFHQRHDRAGDSVADAAHHRRSDHHALVATTHSLICDRITPVFVDIDPVTMNLDATKIEAAVTPHTTAACPARPAWRPLRSQLPRDEGVQHVRGRCHGLPRCEDQAARRLSQEFRLRRRRAVLAYGING